MQEGIVNVSGGGGYPPGGGGPPGGAPPGGWGPPPGSPPGGGYGPPPGAPPGYGPPGAPPGYGPPGAPPPGAPPGYGPPGAPPGGYGPPGAPPGYGPPGAPPGYGPPGAPPPGTPGGPSGPGYGPPGGPPPGGPSPGYPPPGAPPGGGLPPGYVPPGTPPGTPPGYGPPGGAPPGGGGYGPPGGSPGGGFGGGPGGPPGYGPPGGGPGGGFGGPGGPPGYGPPGGYGGGFQPPAATVGGGANWSPMEALSFGWNALMKNFVGVSLPIAVALIVSNLPGQAIGFTYGLMSAVVAEYVEPEFISILGILVQLTTALLGIFISSYIMGGIVSLTLKVVRGQPVSFGDVFSGGKYFGRMLVGYIGLGIASGIGFALCIVPGVILALGLSLWSNIIVDEGLAGIDALKKSWEMTKGHKMNLFVFFLLSGLAFIAGMLACGIGALLVSAPMVMVATSYIYLKLKGEEPRLS